MLLLCLNTNTKSIYFTVYPRNIILSSYAKMSCVFLTYKYTCIKIKTHKKITLHSWQVSVNKPQQFSKQWVARFRKEKRNKILRYFKSKQFVPRSLCLNEIGAKGKGALSPAAYNQSQWKKRREFSCAARGIEREIQWTVARASEAGWIRAVRSISTASLPLCFAPIKSVTLLAGSLRRTCFCIVNGEKRFFCNQDTVHRTCERSGIDQCS